MKKVFLLFSFFISILSVRILPEIFDPRYELACVKKVDGTYVLMHGLREIFVLDPDLPDQGDRLRFNFEGCIFNLSTLGGHVLFPDSRTRPVAFYDFSSKEAVVSTFVANASSMVILKNERLNLIKRGGVMLAIFNSDGSMNHLYSILATKIDKLDIIDGMSYIRLL